MGRRPRAEQPWSSAKLAQAECERLLGTERYAVILKGLRSQVTRPRWQREIVTLASYLRKLGPGLRELERAVADAWALAGEPNAAIVPDSVHESLTEVIEQLRVLPVPKTEEFFKRLKTWLEEGAALMKTARKMPPRGALGAEGQRETRVVASYLVTLDTNEERPITKQIAALLEVANGEAVPDGDADAQRMAWEKRLEKWKKALERARKSASQHHARVRRGGGRKAGRDKRPAKPASVPRK